LEISVLVLLLIVGAKYVYMCLHVVVTDNPLVDAQ